MAVGFDGEAPVPPDEIQKGHFIRRVGAIGIVDVLDQDDLRIGGGVYGGPGPVLPEPLRGSLDDGEEDPAGPQMSKGRLERCPQIARREHIRYGIEEDNRVKRFT